MSHCNYCREEYDKNEVRRVLGHESSVYKFGYCSAFCWTQHQMEYKEVLADPEWKKYKYRLIKSFPGMTYPIGTDFLYGGGGGTGLYVHQNDGLQYSTEWAYESYFKPFVGEFFEKIKL